MGRFGTPWLRALTACVAVGVGLGVAYSGSQQLPAGIGYGVAIAAWLGGLWFGLRAAWLPFAGIGAFGVAAFVADMVSPSPGEHQRAVLVWCLTVIPALFTLPVMVGVGMRHMLTRSRGDTPTD
jgi:hypothetical protein